MANRSKSLSRLKQYIVKVLSTVLTIVVRIGTAPYYRLFHFNTLGVLQRIAQYEQDPKKIAASHHLLRSWRERKLEELRFISIACAVLAGAVIGSFSWFTVESSIWVASACWYSSLVFSILGILLSAQQIGILKMLGVVPAAGESHARQAMDRYKPLFIEPVKLTPGVQALVKSRPRFRPKRSMVFVWQCPVMFMSYSVCLFLLGLTLLVITPLIKFKEKGWTDGAKAAIFYLAASAIAGVAVLFCSFWIYHFVEFEGMDEPATTLSIHASRAPRQGQVSGSIAANQSGG